MKSSKRSFGSCQDYFVHQLSHHDCQLLDDQKNGSKISLFETTGYRVSFDECIATSKRHTDHFEIE